MATKNSHTKKKTTRSSAKRTKKQTVEGFEPTKVALAVACVGATTLVLFSIMLVSSYM